MWWWSSTCKVSAIPHIEIVVQCSKLVSFIIISTEKTGGVVASTVPVTLLPVTSTEVDVLKV